MSPLDRRRFLKSAGAAAAVGAVGVVGAQALQSPAAAAVIEPTFNTNPFQFGVASSPLKNVLWTRLTIAPLATNGTGNMPDGDIELTWKVAKTRTKNGVIAQGTTLARAADGHSARVEAEQLPTDQELFYWFEYQDWSSTVGRLKTAPVATSNPTRMTAAVISCANFEHGYFHCYDHIAGYEVDVIIATGDFTYADSYGPGYGSKVRSHIPAGECYTLADYRRRHSQYRLDPKEQNLRASAGMVITLDDHEVDDDWAGSTPDFAEDGAANSGPGTFWERRHNALQAHWENTPLPWSMKPVRSLMPNSYQTLKWGLLADLHLLDTRQFRSAQSPSGDHVYDEDRYMIGPDQLTELGNSYRGARWDLLVNQVVMARWMAPEDYGDGWLFFHKVADSWDGYRAERDRVVDQWKDKNVRNPVVLTGDVHFAGADLVRSERTGPANAVEIITSSIASGGDITGDWTGAKEVAALIDLPLEFYVRRRGWVKLDVRLGQIQVEWRGTEVISSGAAQPDRLFESATVLDRETRFSNESW